MKRTLKKLIAAVSAAALCAVPMTNGVLVSAAGSQNTYRIYYDAQKTGIADFEISFGYSGDVTTEPSMKTSLCANGNFNSIHYPLSSKVVTTYQGDAIASTGTLATTKLLSSVGFEEIYDVLSFDTPIVKNANGNKMSPSSISIDVVLVGDADGDGMITVADASCIMSYVTNPEKNPLNNPYAADTDGDGFISNIDALRIQQYLARIITHF